LKSNRTIVFAVLIIGLAFGAGLLWRWVQGTPYYAVYEIGAGLKNRNINTILTYVDLESILDQQVSGIVSNLLSNLTAPAPSGKITSPLGEISIQLTPETNKGLSKLAIQQFQKYLEDPKNSTLPSSFTLLALADFKVKQGYALVTLKKDKDLLRMGMKKQETLWRVVELNPEDTQRLIKTYLLPSQK
jgi:hypothetical protein